MFGSVEGSTPQGGIGAAAGRLLRAGSAFCLVLSCPALAAQVQPAADPPAAAPGAPAVPDIPVPPPDTDLPEIEEVISDEEFERLVPELDPADDPELAAPLESIEEFERRLAAEQADMDTEEGAASPTGLPSLADGDTLETIGDAPIRDAELAAPLPPLETFEVAPVEFAEAESDAELVEIAYRVEINGLEAADSETGADLTAMFNEFSALREAGGEAANTAQLSALLTEDSALLQRILSSEGWYEAQVSTRIDRSGVEQGEPFTAVFDVDPGSRYSFAEIVIAAPEVEPPDLIRANLPLQVGEPIVAERVHAAEANVAVQLPQNGYPFAEVGQRDVLLDRDENTGVYTLPVDPGPRARFGEIETVGDLAFGADHVALLARFEPGELYDSRQVDDLRQALVATGLFNTVTVTPQRSGENAGEGAEYATILVEQNAGPPRTLAAGAGFGTGQGFRVEGSWTHRNLFPPEGALIVNAVAGTLEQGAGVTFRRSNAGRRDRTFQLRADALRTNYDAYEAFTGQVSALVSYDSTPIWQKPLTYSYGARLIATDEQDFNFARAALARRTFFIGGLIGQVGLDQTDSLLDPTRGFRVTALVEPEGSLQGGFTPYVRARFDGSAYFPATEAIVIAGRVRLGTIQGIERFDLAPSRRFYAGGGGSVRGFGFQQLGPRVQLPNPRFDPNDPDETADPFIYRPIGGRSLAEAALEVRYRFGNFGVVGFVDAGQVYESSTPSFSDIRFGAGLGGRYYTNFGPVRLDVAMPLDRQDGESSFTVYVSIGQAF